MNLKSKKEMASKILGAGKDRIKFLSPRIEEIKESISKQEIRQLKQEGAIIIKEKKGRKKNIKRNRKRKVGKVKKKLNKRKKDYMNLTRKLRKTISNQKKHEGISKEKAKEIRKKIKNRNFRSKAHLKENILGKK